MLIVRVFFFFRHADEYCYRYIYRKIEETAHASRAKAVIAAPVSHPCFAYFSRRHRSGAALTVRHRRTSILVLSLQTRLVSHHGFFARGDRCLVSAWYVTAKDFLRLLPEEKLAVRTCGYHRPQVHQAAKIFLE